VESGWRFFFMPRPSTLLPCGRHLDGGSVVSYYEENGLPVPQFLEGMACFWYLLPPDYTDQGPRVIVEAMAAGLPVIAENRDGAKDRLTPETGWLVDSHADVAGIINSLTPEVLREKGLAARERAKTEFCKERWIREVLQWAEY